MLTSLIAVVYVGRVIEVAFFHEPAPHSQTAHAREAPALMQAAGLVSLWADVTNRYGAHFLGGGLISLKTPHEVVLNGLSEMQDLAGDYQLWRKPIDISDLNSSKSDLEWAAYVKEKVYSHKDRLKAK